MKLLVSLHAIFTMNAICRKSTVYPVLRFVIPDDKVLWSVPWQEYSPPCFTVDYLKNSSWADPEIDDINFSPKWNDRDGAINRKSYDYNEPINYDVVDRYPLNTRGRTGLRGRGRLGRWGPNHAADALVTRWKRSENNAKVLDPSTGQPVLQFLSILRKDCRKWAIPGGFVDANEEAATATVRELFEEAINISRFPKEDQASLENFLKQGNKIYKGYVDDPRNTDNSWIETTVTNFHDESGEHTSKLILEARDDAADVKWMDIVNDKCLDTYEPHNDILKIVIDLHLKPKEKI